VRAFYGTRDRIVDVTPLAQIAKRHRNIQLSAVPGAAHGFLVWRPWVIRQTVSWASWIARSMDRD
jgi:hypothetical protein